jgi:hypothetical protein
MKRNHRLVDRGSIPKDNHLLTLISNGERKNICKETERKNRCKETERKNRIMETGGVMVTRGV